MDKTKIIERGEVLPVNGKIGRLSLLKELASQAAFFKGRKLAETTVTLLMMEVILCTTFSLTTFNGLEIGAARL